MRSNDLVGHVALFKFSAWIDLVSCLIEASYAYVCTCVLLYHHEYMCFVVCRAQVARRKSEDSSIR